MADSSNQVCDDRCPLPLEYLVAEEKGDRRIRLVLLPDCLLDNQFSRTKVLSQFGFTQPPRMAKWTSSSSLRSISPMLDCPAAESQ